MDSVTTQKNDGVYQVTINRPEQMNALDVDALGRLLDAVTTAGQDDSIRCLVLTAQGRGFCTGADVNEWADAHANGTLETYGWTERAHELMLCLAELRVPTIAAISGIAVGAGIDLALCCDFRIASRSARFKPGYTSMAYAPDAGGSWWLPRIVGDMAAKRFLFLDETWSADTALETGLLMSVHEDDELPSATLELAKRLARGPTFAFEKSKELIRQSRNHSLAEQLAAEQQAGIACGRTEDAVEAVRASTQKRAPQFIGK